MNEEGHRQRAEELKGSRALLTPPEGHIALYTEASLGIAHQLFMAGSQRKYGTHEDQHQGLARWLRDRGETAMAEHLTELEAMRAGRWYGRRGNGSAAQRQDELLDAIAQWSLA